MKELLTSIENLIALKWLCLSGCSHLKELSTFVDQIDCPWKIGLVKVLIVEGVTYIYWQIDCLCKVELVRVLVVGGVSCIYYQIECFSIFRFNNAFKTKRVTYICQWIEWLDLSRCLKLKDLPSIDKLLLLNAWICQGVHSWKSYL